ncbi:bacillithiol biosynthesis cysteine-adding enzyme BshC [Lentiprolixibacter aurantiacus]|uniref:Putative cysteine ligase BshC n=1 Tax=Lentiprolixibacter aurantiacus TaxID=2993939 RepID=A0AAE3MNA0_9FLAO|nr:bacillithiol biosynthesis cysteine-adding enzyme BshC [Lentiprolixibacter aurantiacus]MCX2720007.1 bacillithiol biosynthesis cysteine-adding enzyme BshC [Lentiprolixibacter aurantiacus]
MESDCIPFRETGYFSGLICDYLDQHAGLQQFYNRFPSLEAFGDQIKEKSAAYPKAHRKVLFDCLPEQYKGFEASKATVTNLKLLQNENTFTVVTGHQLNLFTGPLYFLYKIISTINLTKQLKEQYPGKHFVPVYWMATEDHDFDEINYFNFQGRKLQWNRNEGGAVGRMDTNGLEEVWKAFKEHLGPGNNARDLELLFKSAYLEHDTLAGATRYLANELFGPYGLVIIDGDDPVLKRLMIPIIEKDLLENATHKEVTRSIGNLKKLEKAYKVQVNPRKLNYFYLTDGLRERLEERNGRYHVLNTDLVFSQEEILKELNTHPERFSPNVITRPIYQEVILPNLCYIGGGGELAYWLQLKPAFDALDITFPVLLLRNSVLMVSKKQVRKMVKLDLKMADLFLKQSAFINKRIRQISNIEIDFSEQKDLLAKQFEDLYSLAEQTDQSFLGAVKAQEIKQKKGLDKLEKRLLKAQKRKLKDEVERMTALQDQLFPGKSLQERQLNFSEIYLELGAELIPALIRNLDPLDLRFSIITY